MHDPEDQPQTLAVTPPLADHEVEVVAGLAGAGPGPRRVWPGQPGRRSPWRPCADGCCLTLARVPGFDAVQWLEFLVREVLAPRAKVPRERARQLGLPGGHRVRGRVPIDWFGQPCLMVASGRQVRLVAADDAPDPVDHEGRHQSGEVVKKGGRSTQSTER